MNGVESPSPPSPSGGTAHDLSQCTAMVYVRDTYRYTGRGKARFAMHYIRRQCRRPITVVATGLCWQHAQLIGDEA